MGEEIKKGQEEGQEEQLEDLDIAELANKKLKEKDKEIIKLKKELAREKLLSQAEEEEPVVRPTKEECIKIIGSENTTNYDYAEATCNLVDICRENGEPNPLGENGDKVYDFFKEVIEDCDGDKSRFVHLYQSKIGPDDKKVAMAHQARNIRK